MTSPSSPATGCAVDAQVLVYSLLDQHPASMACEQFLLRHAGWFTGLPILLEVKNVLAKVYQVAPNLVSKKLTVLLNGPLTLVDLSNAEAIRAIEVADQEGLDISDAVLLLLAQKQQAAFLATEDQRLTQACGRFGMAVQSPLDDALRGQVAAWEQSNLAPKGIQRVLRRIHEWLLQHYPQAESHYWSQTGQGSHLP